MLRFIVDRATSRGFSSTHRVSSALCSPPAIDAGRSELRQLEIEEFAKSGAAGHPSPRGGLDTVSAIGC